MHEALLGRLLRDGIVPPPAASAALGAGLVALPTLLQVPAGADNAAPRLPAEIACLYPFAVAPAPHVVIGGE